MSEFILSELMPKPKARPRSLRSGGIYMPPEYMAWKQEVRRLLNERYPDLEPTQEQVYMAISFFCPRRPRGDIDNLAGGLLDAIQVDKYSHGRGILQDDRQVVRLVVSWVKSASTKTVIAIWGEEERLCWAKYLNQIDKETL